VVPFYAARVSDLGLGCLTKSVSIPYTIYNVRQCIPHKPTAKNNGTRLALRGTNGSDQDQLRWKCE